MRHSAPCTAGAVIAVLALPVVPAAAAAHAHAHTHRTARARARGANQVPRVHFDDEVPTLLGGGETVTLRGTVKNTGAGAAIVLEIREAGGRWKASVRAPVHKGAFKLKWLPPAGRTIALRFAVRRSRHLLTLSTTLTVRIGAAPQYCPMPRAPTDVPAGDGWISGGLYRAGGPEPGTLACESGPYSISAINEAGTAVTTQEVAGSDYTLIVPPGNYELDAMSGACYSEQTIIVVAGKGVQARTICDIE